MRLFDFISYQEFVSAKLKSMPGGGRGQYRRIAEHLGVHTTLVSQIFRGTKLMSVEHALGICDYFGLNEMETEYFLALVQAERAGNAKLKSLYRKQAERAREKGRRVENRLPQDKKLSEEDKAVFYSNWWYSGIRVLSSVGGGQTAEALAAHFGLPIALVNQVLAFLVSRGLCIEKEGGLYDSGPKRTLLDSSSPYLARHHANWRQRAVEQFPRLSSTDFVLTSPSSISKRGFDAVRSECANLVESVSRHVAADDPELMVAFNIDWLEVGKVGK